MSIQRLYQNLLQEQQDINLISIPSPSRGDGSDHFNTKAALDKAVHELDAETSMKAPVVPSDENGEARIENVELEIDEPVSYNELLPLTQEDITREWINAFVPDSNDKFTQKPVMQKSLLHHAIQEQSRRYEEICQLFDTTDEIMEEIFFSYEVKRQSHIRFPSVCLLPLSKTALLKQLSVKVAESWEYSQVHDWNLDTCLIQRVKDDRDKSKILSHKIRKLMEASRQGSAGQ